MRPNDADGMANSVDTDQTARSSLIWVYTVCPGQSDQCLHCLPRRICPKTYDNYGSLFFLLLQSVMP